MRKRTEILIELLSHAFIHFVSVKDAASAKEKLDNFEYDGMPFLCYTDINLARS